MKIAHLILAHSRPQQLGELVSLLQHPLSDIYIHLDKKSNAPDFAFIKNHPRVSFIKKNIKVYWAHYSMVQAVLNSFEEIIEKDYDYINVISGQDLPIKSSERFHDFLSANNGKQFIICDDIENDWPEAAIRLTTYDIPKYKFKGKYRLFQLLNKILPERKFPLPYQIVGRANWFTITTEATNYILSTVKANPKLEKFFKYTWASDEIIFSTILFNSPFKNKIEDNLVYVNWNWEGKESGHPKILDHTDLVNIKTSDKFFARKFDLSLNADVLDHIRALHSQTNEN